MQEAHETVKSLGPHTNNCSQSSLAHNSDGSLKTDSVKLTACIG
jgi:hypothetical protein